jgi:hypothetical protein
MPRSNCALCGGRGMVGELACGRCEGADHRPLVIALLASAAAAAWLGYKFVTVAVLP